jgi:hypothetical protein
LSLSFENILFLSYYAIFYNYTLRFYYSNFSFKEMFQSFAEGIFSSFLITGSHIADYTAHLNIRISDYKIETQ